MEKRRSVRKPFRGSIEIDELYNQERVVTSPYTVDVEFYNISKGGIGFLSTAELPLDFYFNAKIDLGNGTGFYAVLKVVRSEPDVVSGGYRYGCEFVGLADVLAILIDGYEG